MKRLKLLALSGSLRKSSYNTAAIEALIDLSPNHVEIDPGSNDNLLLFNPDREGERISELENLKTVLKESAGLKRGEEILNINGVEVKSGTDILRILSNIKPDQNISIKLRKWRSTPSGANVKLIDVNRFLRSTGEEWTK